MDNTVRVQVLEGVDDLLGVAFDLQFMQPLSALQQFIHALVLAQLQQDIHIFTVFEKMKELSHICMLNRPMNFDFAHQLLLCPAPLQRGLLDNLGCTDCLRVHLNELVAFGEATLAKEFSLDILPVSHFTILMLYALLDDLVLGCWIAAIASARRVQVRLAAAVRAALNHGRSLISGSCISISSSSWRLRLQAIGPIGILRHRKLCFGKCL